MKDNQLNELQNKGMQIAFSAIDQRLKINIPSGEQKKTSTYTFYGSDNKYPNFLYNAYNSCPSLQTIINGLADYTVGNGISSTVLTKPNPNMSWDEFVNHLAADLWLYGICYYQVIRDKGGREAELYWLDALYMRTDDYEETFWYNEDFGKDYVKKQNTIIYPKYKKDILDPASVVCVKTPLGKGAYGSPLWIAGIKAVMTEIAIDDFHLNEIDNNFAGSAIINFNNGIPTDEDKEHIERMIGKKFCGHENAGRFLLSFNNGGDNATTIERLNADDFDDRYESLANKTQKQIFTAFGVSPVLFGIEKDTTGFNSEDYKQAFLLANRTRIYPFQKRLIDSIDRVLGTTGSIKIEPFSIDFEDTNNNENTETVN